MSWYSAQHPALGAAHKLDLRRAFTPHLWSCLAPGCLWTQWWSQSHPRAEDLCCPSKTTVTPISTVLGWGALQIMLIVDAHRHRISNSSVLPAKEPIWGVLLAVKVYCSLSSSPSTLVQAYSWDWESIRDTSSSQSTPQLAGIPRLSASTVVLQPLVDTMPMVELFFQASVSTARRPDTGFLIGSPQHSYGPQV